jgi:DNA repair ATPase RecN
LATKELMNLSNEIRQDLENVQRIEHALGLINTHVVEIDKNVQAVELRLEQYNSTLKVNTSSLEHHVKRTDVAEDRITLVESRFFTLMTALIMAFVGAMLAFLFKK